MTGSVSLHRVPMIVWMGTIVAFSSFNTAANAGEELLIRATVDGRRTSLYEKVVVTSAKATLSPRPSDRGDPIEPFAIFFSR